VNSGQIDLPQVFDQGLDRKKAEASRGLSKMLDPERVNDFETLTLGI
jgi:hypothetical protein